MGLLTSVLDHGALTGLSDDDHTQYVLRSILTTRGDLPVRGASDWTRFGVGGANTVLTADGTDPAWSATPTVTTLTTTGLLTAGNGLTVSAGNINLPSGQVFSWASDDVTLTHSADTLTLAGGILSLPGGSVTATALNFGTVNSGLINFDGLVGFVYGGAVRFLWGINHTLGNGTGLFWADNPDPTVGGIDIRLVHDAADILQMGADAASPTAQTFKGSDARAGTDTNAAGGILRLAGGRATGTGLPGLVGFQGSLLSVTTGTAASTLIDRFIANAAKVLTDNSAIAIVNATVVTETVVGGLITYTIEVTDGTDVQVETGQAVYSTSNKGGTVAGTITEINSQQNLTGGSTLATTWAISNANPAVISINANSSLVPSTGYPRITFSIQNLGQQAIAIQ